MTSEARDALLPAIASGDVPAFAKWLGHAEPRLRLSLSRFARVVDTEAVLQETLLRLWQIAPRVHVDPRGDSLIRLGIQIARNLAVDQVRRDRRLGEVTELQIEDAPNESGDTTAPDPLLRKAVERCVKQLPKQPAAALMCRIEDGGGAPDEELAERLGMQRNTFLKNFGRARQFLLKCLGRAGVELTGLLPAPSRSRP